MNSCRAFLPLFHVMKTQIRVNSLQPARQYYPKEAIKWKHTWNWNVGCAQQRWTGARGENPALTCCSSTGRVPNSQRGHQPNRRWEERWQFKHRAMNDMEFWLRKTHTMEPGRTFLLTTGYPVSRLTQTYFLFVSHRFAYVLFLIQPCKGKENPTAWARSGLPPSPPSPRFAVPSYPK